MVDLITSFIEVFFKYSLIYFYLFLAGRSSMLLFNKLFKKKWVLNKYTLFTKNEILFPIIGLSVVGNILILLNYFLPLKSFLVLVFLILFLSPNILEMKNLIRSKFSFHSFFYFVLLPSVLLISSFDVGFHYDAGYYHLNHQNWLRESNLILGMVNIFWPFGMSSIYEYFSAILWVDESFISLHFLTILFIHFFYLLVIDNLVDGNNKRLRNAAFFLIIFSLLDNFGYEGGRNGFIFIQGVGKQDVAVGVLFFFISFVTFLYIYEEKISKNDIFALSILTLFIFQIKVSGAFIVYLYLILFITLLIKKTYNFKDLFYVHIPAIIFSAIWFTKSILTTGCLIFPLSFTCLNNFDWYVKGSTEIYEKITRTSSLAFIDYYRDFEKNYSDWVSDILAIEFYRAVLLNFLISFFILVLLKIVFFKPERNDKRFIYIVFPYVLINVVYLIFFGPIPRYSIGIMLFVVSLVSLYAQDFNFQIKNWTSYFLVLLSVIFIVRLGSYSEFLNNQNYKVFNPREEAKYIEVNENWVIPDEGDQCWINLECSMAKEYNPKIDDVIFKEGTLFKTAERIFYLP